MFVSNFLSGYTKQSFTIFKIFVYRVLVYLHLISFYGTAQNMGSVWEKIKSFILRRSNGYVKLIL